MKLACSRCRKDLSVFAELLGRVKADSEVFCARCGAKYWAENPHVDFQVRTNEDPLDVR